MPRTKAKRLLVTGVSGYLGGALCRLLDHRPWCKRIDGLDVQPPLYKYDKVHFLHGDVTDPKLSQQVEDLQPDVVLHLAAIVDPILDEELIHRVNVDGTRNVLEAAGAAGARQILVTGSGSAYGAWPDNPVPMDETQPLRPVPGFRYANDKAEVEALCETFAQQHPEVTLATVRPCVIYGPLVDNYLSAVLTRLPWITGLRDYDPQLQFVHEDDVARAIVAVVEQQATGAFNVAPPDTVRMSEVLALAAKPKIKLPLWLLEPLVDLCWQRQWPLLGAPPAVLGYFKYPWVLDSKRLREELGFTFRYSSRETLETLLRAKGLMVG